jgi:beta-barrel assembly-enhancing protease
MNRRSRCTCRISLSLAAWAVTMIVMLTPFAFAQRTRLKPGWNLFSPQQDVELGQQVSKDAEKKLSMLKNQRVDDYLNQLGKKLAAVAPGEKYPYQFRCVNDAEINAFALPGGFLFVNRGTIEAADNEAELAGVMGHEIGHVVLRHGTNQASKQQLAQAPLAILGSILGDKSTVALLAQLGSEFTISSVLLKYSRDDERQADLMGTQILYDCNYDPTYMAKFFEKLQSKGRSVEFLSSHPNPENRMQSIKLEISKIGPLPGKTANDSGDFRSIRQLVKSLPPAPKAAEGQTKTTSTGPSGRPQRPSDRLRSYDGENISLSYPDNWKESESDQGLTLAPDGGVVDRGIAYGVTMSIFNPGADTLSSAGLTEATDQLLADLRKSNTGMRVAKDKGRIRVGGETASSKILSNDSPDGGRETDWLVTVLRPEGLVYFIFIAPEQEFADYERAFQQILNSVNFGSR